MQLKSDAFEPGGDIPRRYTKDGENVSPPLRWSDIPNGTRELALVMEDTKTGRGGPFTHWVLYGISAERDSLPDDLSHKRHPELEGDARHGTNDLENVGYDGPQPPLGRAHEFHFKLYALDRAVDAEAGLAKRELENRLANHVLAEAELIGRYARPR